MKLISVLFLLSLVLQTSCSLRGEDVLTKLSRLNQKRDYRKFDPAFAKGTLKLRNKNLNSLHAHTSYIDARRGMKAVVAEYKILKEKNKTPFFNYLALRAELSSLSYRDQAERKRIAKELEKIGSDSKEIRDEVIYDLAAHGYILRDKKKHREFAKELVAKKPNYLPYKKLMANHFDQKEDLREIFKYCEEGLKAKPPIFSFCTKLRGLTKEKAGDQLTKRDELLKKYISLSSKSKNEKQWEIAYYLIKQLVDSNEDIGSQLKDELVAKVLKKRPNWIPNEVYRLYYEGIDYQGFEFVLELGKVNKMIDFKKRVEKLEELLKTPGLSKGREADIYIMLGSAFLNPANENKEKAFKYYIKSNEIEALGSYYTETLLTLIYDLKKESDLGLMLIEDRFKKVLTDTEKFQVLGADSTEDLSESIKREIASLYLFKGKFLLRKKQEDEARLAFLNSFNSKPMEENAYYLGKLYLPKNEMLAMDFLLRSVLNKSESEALNEKSAKDRDRLLNGIYKKYYGKVISQKEVLALYDDKETKEEEKLHELVGKPLLTDTLKDLKGGNFDWNKLKGKNTIVSFWATWCTPCFQEMAVLNKIQKEGKIKDLKIIGICTDGLEQTRKVKKIVKNGSIEFDILLDDGTFRDKYSVSAIPSMFFLNKAGTFIKQKTGYSPKLEKEIFKIYN